MDITDEEVDAFLRDLRASGSVNMVGASKDLQEEFGFTRREATTRLRKWTESYNG